MDKGGSPARSVPRSVREITGHIRGLLFDKDGTLVDYAKSWTPVNRRAARLAAGGDGDLTRRLLIVGGADAETGEAAASGLLAMGSTAEIASAWVSAGAPTDVERLTRALDELFVSSVDDAVPVTDLKTVLGRLRARGLKLGIASSDSEAAVRATEFRFGIDDLIDFRAGYDSGFSVKPAPDAVAAFCACAGLAAREIAVIGDSVNDMLMGRAAGAGITVGILSGTSAATDLGAYADICIDSVADLERALFR
jgi:phosphoglycolate phosphatase